MLSPLLDEKLGRLSTAIDLALSQLTSQAQRLTEVEERVSTLEDGLTHLQTSVESHDSLLSSLIDKVDDLENRSRRNNLRIVRLPETVKGPQLHHVVSSWLPTALGLTDNLALTVERVHRLGPDLSPSLGPPRTVIFQLLNFSDKIRIMQAYRKANTLEHNGTTLRLFQDFSASLAARRRAFAPICSKLAAANVRFTLQYPARLRVHLHGQVTFYDSPTDALTILEDDTARSPSSTSTRQRSSNPPT
uniref:LINE-1 type transposase domain-containing protein 1 n=1 Tax=Leptobrachium leishanense TaxID=445787 RepID=A0A8C5QXN8_9ANUR